MCLLLPMQIILSLGAVGIAQLLPLQPSRDWDQQELLLLQRLGPLYLLLLLCCSMRRARRVIHLTSVVLQICCPYWQDIISVRGTHQRTAFIQAYCCPMSLERFDLRLPCGISNPRQPHSSPLRILAHALQVDYKAIDEQKAKEQEAEQRAEAERKAKQARGVPDTVVDPATTTRRSRRHSKRDRRKSEPEPRPAASCEDELPIPTVCKQL